MANYRIKAIIESETIFGSGKSRGQINEDCQYDEDGFIFYNAKALKGVLRSTGELIINSCKEKELEEKFYKLFGATYFEDVKNRNNGELRFSNLQISDEMKKALKDLGNKHEILQAMTNIRQFIRIDKNGVTKENSLRNIRTIKEKMVFYSELGEHELTNEEKFLALIVKSTKYLGMNISKGRGKVKLSLLKDNIEVKTSAREVIG